MKKIFFFRKKQTQKGFTLIELLVTIGILGMVVAIGVGIFFSLLRGAGKARVLTEVKQNGDYALKAMERMIRNAKGLKEPVESGETSTITIINPDDQITIFACDGSRIASDGATLTSDKLEVENCLFTVTKGKTNITPDQIKINFTLKQAETDGRSSEKVMIDFQSTVNLRNLTEE